VQKRIEDQKNKFVLVRS